mgnify:CR=1 FL=1
MTMTRPDAVWTAPSQKPSVPMEAGADLRPLPSRLGQRAHDERAVVRERGLNGGPCPRHARHCVGQFYSPRCGARHRRSPQRRWCPVPACRGPRDSRVRAARCAATRRDRSPPLRSRHGEAAGRAEAMRYRGARTAQIMHGPSDAARLSRPRRWLGARSCAVRGVAVRRVHEGVRTRRRPNSPCSGGPSLVAKGRAERARPRRAATCLPLPARRQPDHDALVVVRARGDR